MVDLPFFKPTVSGGSYEGVIDFKINENGELIATFVDGTTKNIGRVVGKNGGVYVPFIDERKVLSFKLEEDPQTIPEPVDLNPNDEENSIDGNAAESDYVWEGIS